MSDFLKVTTDASFEQDVVKSSGLVLVDFWAPWCHPCKMIMPQVALFAEEYADKGVTVYKLDVSENAETPKKFGIQGIPALFLFKNGEIVAKQAGGGVNKLVLMKMADEHLSA